MNRLLCVATLLLILLGSALGDVHAATHIAADPGDCALCASNANSTAVAAASGRPVLPTRKPIPCPEVRHVLYRSSAIVSLQPRGPPQSF